MQPINIERVKPVGADDALIIWFKMWDLKFIFTCGKFPAMTLSELFYTKKRCLLEIISSVSQTQLPKSSASVHSDNLTMAKSRRVHHPPRPAQYSE